jgi:NADH-quinone oxidoreductase subunit M
MLAGVLLKMGAYGMARVSIPAVPEAFTTYAPVLAALGIAGIVYGAAMALGQSDLKRLVAYSSVAHMGFVLLGLASGSELGLSGAMLGMVSHGIVSGLLFFLVGALQDRAHTRDMSAFGGLGQELPRWATVFVVASLASLGLPGLSGFPGEFATVLASFERWGWWLAVAGVGIVLAAAYSLRAVRTVVHGEPRDIGPMRDLGVYELAAVVPLVVLTAILGIWPRIVTDLSAATLAALSAVLGTVD